MIITDDDDGDLSNLTPHFHEIITAFDNHNISLFGDYHHTALPHTKDSADAYLVEMTIPFVNKIMPVDEV
jgi:hypothetical protein